MKKFLFAAGITIAGLTTLYAQDVKQAAPTKTTVSLTRAQNFQKATPEEIAQRRTERIDKAVTLTADQKKQVHDIFLSETKNSDRSAQMKETDEQLKALFNEDQNKKYEAMKAEQQKQMKDRMNNMREDRKISAKP